MKQTIEIEVPDGKKAIWKDNKIVFEDIISKLPDTWKKFCDYHPIKAEERFINLDCSIKVNAGDRSYSSDKNMLPSEKAAKAHLALMQLHQLRDCYRQGWIPDWNSNKFKYCIYYYNNDYRIRQIVDNSHFLTFQSIELAEKFLKNFKDLIKQAGDLI